MCSKYLLVAFAVTIVSMIEALCPSDSTPTPPAPTQPKTTKTFTQLYHPCPRSLLSYQFLFQNGPAVRCALGPTGNLCKGDSCGADLICCQGQNGCNSCVGKYITESLRMV